METTVLKQLTFGARASSPVPICRHSNYHDSECSRCARRIMLFLKVVLVVSKSQYAWVENADAPGKYVTRTRRRLRGSRRRCASRCPLSRRAGTSAAHSGTRVFMLLQLLYGWHTYPMLVRNPHLPDCPTSPTLHGLRGRTFPDRGLGNMPR